MPGRLGALAVVECAPISGARRASRKAQSAMEDSAKQLELARERFSGLMRGLAADLDLSGEELRRMVETAAVELALEDCLAALAAARGAVLAAPGDLSAVLEQVDAAERLLRASVAGRGAELRSDG